MRPSACQGSRLTPRRKGLVDSAALDALVDRYEHKIGPRNGARVVARAWVDPVYKARLLADANDAMADFGYVSKQGDRMVVVRCRPNAYGFSTLQSSVLLALARRRAWS